MSRPVDVLLEFLAAEQARGVTHVHLDDGARDALREVFHAARAQKIDSSAEKSAALSVAEIHPDEPHVPVTAAATPTLEGTSPAEQLASLRSQAADWTPIKSLGSLREKMVFASGNPAARLMLVGEAPGYHEEREGCPFAGDVAQKLDGILKAMGLSREEVYISYIVKFRPSTPRQTTNNRKPTPEEMAACLPFIRAEIAIVRPACIIAFGDTAAAGLLGTNKAVTAMRESWYDFAATPVRVTYHPSTLLQTHGASTTKRQLWEDMLAVMEKLELPISDKQRGFFLPKA